jgi:hypothetical protein
MNGKVEVPAWVMGVTYVLCWSFAIAITVAQLIGHIEYRPLLLALGVYLLLWPVFQVSPADLVRRILPS